MAKLVCLLLLLAWCALAQSVEGTVVDAATGVGIFGVKVELLRGTSPFYETSSDGAGRFRFDNVRETDYAVRYQSPDYWLTTGPTDYKAFPIAAGNTVKLEARLMPWSKISGKVVDGRGKGVGKAQVELSGAGMIANGRTYVRTSWGGGGGGVLSDAARPMTFRGETDADGKFEVQLMPGAYGLCVTAPADLKPPEPEADGPTLAWKRTYYPGVALAEEATKIVVLPSGQILDLEVKLLAVPVHAVRGMVVNPDGTPAGKAGIFWGEQFLPTFEAKPDGTFEIPAAAEGEWRISAERKQGAVKLRSAEWIEVAKHDVENVKLQLMAPVKLQGSVIFEGPKDAPAPKPANMMLELRGGHTRLPGDLGFISGAILSVDGKGEFAVAELLPGLYELGPMLQPAAAPYYLDSITVGGADLLLQAVEIASDVEVRMVYKADGGSVAGKAENCNAGGVLLVPANPAQRRPNSSKSGACDGAGHYEVRGVRPGEYLALAFAGNGPAPELNEIVLKQAAKVTVRSGETAALDLSAVTKPVY